MNRPLLTLPIELENDVVVARQRARQIASAIGLDNQDQVRIATAVSEIARNAFDYAGGGRAAFSIADRADHQRLVVEIADRGPGIVDLADILAGRFTSRTGLGLGIVGARRLMDHVEIDTEPGGGTTVRLERRLATGRWIGNDALPGIVEAVRRLAPTDAYAELRDQNRELMEAGTQLAGQAEELRRLNETLEERVEAAVAARRMAEDRVRQSQKMEAMGQLTGGIAHDFNNMLAAVGSGMRLLEKRLDDRPDVRVYVDAIHDALDRAGALTKRLLAFARQQPLQSETVDANALVEGIGDLLVRTLGHGIAVAFDLDPEAGNVFVDASEFENVLLNLCVNARDAMPGGGRLEIVTRPVRSWDLPGEHREGPETRWFGLSVKDTGSGMSPEVLAKALEPFFTTKDAGKGTGLGLAQVYGFANEANGFVDLRSSVGVGTTVSVFLPNVASRAIHTGNGA